MENNKMNKIDKVSDLDKGLVFSDQTKTCRRCIEKLDNDFKTYKKNLLYCKSCSALVDHWLNSEFKDRAFDL